MESLINSIVHSYRYYLYEKADKRTAEYFFVNQWIVLSVLIIYLLFIKKIGPEFMKDRKPFKLNGILLAYNAVQVLINLYIVTEGTRIIFSLDWRCSNVTTSLTPRDQVMLHLGYLYYITKFVDLLDTVFFVLRKKYNQVTFLHLYHHMVMICVTWIAMKYAAGGHSSYEVYINSIVHAIMYSYYFITAWNEQNRSRTLWWKKYITQIQLVQFLISGVLYIQPLITEGCKYSKTFSILALSQSVIMTVLFSKFYYKAYIKKTN